MFQRLANTLALTTLGTLIATTAIAQNKTDIAWGGSNPGGVMYYMVGVAGTELGKDLPDVNITQVTTGGSTIPAGATSRFSRSSTTRKRAPGPTTPRPCLTTLLS